MPQAMAKRILCGGLFVVAALLTTTPAAHADLDLPYDPAPLNACIAEAGDSLTALEACQGASATPCVRADGGATMSLVLCWDAEATAWRELMETVIARLDRDDPDRTAVLHRAQEAWRAWVDIECGYRGDGYQGGSGAQPAMVRCVVELTARRTIMLIQSERDR